MYISRIVSIVFRCGGRSLRIFKFNPDRRGVNRYQMRIRYVFNVDRPLVFVSIPCGTRYIPIIDRFGFRVIEHIINRFALLGHVICQCLGRGERGGTVLTICVKNAAKRGQILGVHAFQFHHEPLHTYESERHEL